ncbi:hypothetical protein P3W45_000072 [Vairimorpha bombi]|jgi:histone H3/H4
MDDLINHCIIRIVKEHGYDYADKRAILLIKEALERHINSILKVFHSYTIHSKKQSANAFDLLSVLKDTKFSVNTRLTPMLYSQVEEEPCFDFKSPLSTYLERYIHIYEFMPPFPPTHTFRQTYLKNKEKEDKSQLVKTRLEQSLRSEKNLLKLIKGSGSLPSFINYLYKK